MKNKQKWMIAVALGFSLSQSVGAQEPAPAPQAPPTGWRRFGDGKQAPARVVAQDQQQPQQDPQGPQDAPPPPPPQQDQRQYAPPQGPVTLTAPAGTWVTVRVNQHLSSDHNQPGDAFTATLMQPIVADGRIIARRGQTVAGVVSEAEKAGRVKGTSRLGIELTELSLVDGRQIPIKTRMTERRGDTSVGRDATAIGVTTGTGAAIGAAVNGGVGAGVGAAAGVVASTIGVLVTRGRATEVYPEMMLTFRLEAPLVLNLTNTQDAFLPVTQQDYDSRQGGQPSLRYRTPGPAPYYYGGYYPGYYPSYWGPGYGYWGPSFYFGSRFGGYGYRGGFRR
jgi:hypothetical protein